MRFALNIGCAAAGDFELTAMIRRLLRQLIQANDFIFVAEVIALAIALNLVLLLLAIGIAPIVRKLWKGRHGVDQNESSASFAQWATRCFAKNTGIQVAWSIGVYIVFSLLNLPQGNSRLFIIGVNLICSISAFTESMGRGVKKDERGLELARLLEEWRQRGLLTPSTPRLAWSQRGGVRIGSRPLWSLNLSWPLGCLTATADSIEISYLFGRVTLQRRDLERIELYRGIFSEGLRFRHVSQDVPRLVVFWPLNFANLALKLGQLGFESYLAPERARIGGQVA
jgi:hypothetical protein